MKLGLTESTLIEFKREYVKDINKTIIAFANTQGGTLYIGVADDATIIGVTDADKTCVKVTNAIRGSISPDLIMLVNCNIEKYDDKEVVRVDVQRGTAIPYFLKSEGLKPQSVFLRHGTSSVPVTEEAFLRLIRNSRPQENYENLPSLNQNLTFNEALPIFAAKEFLLDEVLQKKLKLKNEEGLYTNLGLLISDQCPQTVKVSAFRDSAGANVSSWKEFTGSLLKQNEEIYRFIDIHNDNAIIGIAKNLQRIERWSFPPDAVREALLNLLIHRDLSIRHSSQIKIYKDRMEFMSFGALPEGVSLADVKRGAVAHRNRNLVEVFRRLGHIEAFGFGIPKIMNIYKAEQLEPPLEQTDSLFIITLPNLHEAPLKSTSGATQITPGHSVAVIKQYSREEVLILALFKTKEYITRKDVEEVLTVSKAMANRYLNALVAKGMVSSTGSARSTRYYLTSKEEKSN